MAGKGWQDDRGPAKVQIVLNAEDLGASATLRQRRLIALSRTEAWMSSEDFMHKYGAGEDPAQPHKERDRQ